ncbi:hypothetical protein CTI12_AA448950 [Artemisia annua]|uniref:Uncharacterized protein n=1 Tax=Artemisia annua TaxID=35608 RepID=A0A2U1LDT6_ARTAN|nr:hypothetical protein CTI12_AA448950 [Artemisia annua]
MKSTRTANPYPVVNLDALSERMARLKKGDAGYDSTLTQQQVRVCEHPIRFDNMHNQVVDDFMSQNITDIGCVCNLCDASKFKNLVIRVVFEERLAGPLMGDINFLIHLLSVWNRMVP